MAPWLRFLEAWMVQQLLRTPAFHRGVERVVRAVHRVRHGTPPEEMGGTRIDSPTTNGSFLRHFTNEVQTQLGRAEARIGQGGVKGEHTVSSASTTTRRATTEPHRTVAAEEDESAEAVWRTAQKNSTEPPKQGFMGEYAGALREQLRGGKGNR